MLVLMSLMAPTPLTAALLLPASLYPLRIEEQNLICMNKFNRTTHCFATDMVAFGLFCH